VSKNKTWSPDGNWIAYTRTPDSIDGTTKICLVSPLGGSPSRIVADAKGSPDQDIALRWVNQNTLSWFSEMRTWVSTIEYPKPVQFFEDSTDARMIKGGRFVLYRDHRVGRPGWWLEASPLEAKGSKRTPRKILEAVTAIIAPGGEFLLYSPKGRELHRVSLPDGKETRLPYSSPDYLEHFGVITQDGKSVITLEQASNSKLMLWENPFIKE
jgi:hypothetical protein